MNEDFPWFLFAMVIIAFLRWIVLKIQGKSVTDDFDETFFAEDDEEKERAQRSIENRADPTLDPNEEIRKFFDALGGRAQTETAPPPPLPVAERAAPPPIPAKPKAPPAAVKRATKPSLSPVEEAALKRVRAGATLGEHRKRRRGTAPAPATLQGLVGSSQGLKSAVLLKEILDKPKGLEAPGEFPALFK